MKDTMSYRDALRAKKDEAIAEQEDKFYEMAPKSSPFGEVSTAPSQTVTGAKQALGESGQTFMGSGGYEYGANADGSFMILKSGRGAAPGTVVMPGMKGYEDIKKEFEDVKAGRPVSSKPRSMSTSRKPGDLTPEQGAAEAKRVSAAGPGLDVANQRPASSSTKAIARSALPSQAHRALMTSGMDKGVADTVIAHLIGNAGENPGALETLQRLASPSALPSTRTSTPAPRGSYQDSDEPLARSVGRRPSSSPPAASASKSTGYREADEPLVRSMGRR